MAERSVSTSSAKPSDTRNRKPGDGNEPPPLPSGLVAVGRYMGQVGRRIPVVNAMERRARAIEERVLTGLGERMQRARGGGESGSSGGSREGAERTQRTQRAFYVPVHEPPQRLLSDLLAIAARQDEHDAREYLFTATLRELTPDEARLMAALSDGKSRAILHINATGNRLAGPSERVAGYLSTLGDEADVRLPDRIGHYLGRMVDKGLVVEGAPTAESKAYQGSLLASTVVTRELERLRQARIRPKLVHGSVALSRFGRELWAHCDDGGLGAKVGEERRIAQNA